MVFLTRVSLLTRLVATSCPNAVREKKLHLLRALRDIRRRGGVGAPGSQAAAGGQHLAQTTTAAAADADQALDGNSYSQAEPVFTNAEKDVLDSLIGHRRDLPQSYAAADTVQYRLATMDARLRDAGAAAAADSAAGSNNNGDDEVATLFSTVPAIRGVKEVVENDLCLDFSKLSLHEHYMQLYRPMPAAGNVHSIVELADITETAGARGTLFTFDVVTRDSSDRFLTFNQFCFSLLGCYDICHKFKLRSHRSIPDIRNKYEDMMPQMAFHCQTAEDQQTAMSRLTGYDGDLPDGLHALAHHGGGHGGHFGRRSLSAPRRSWRGRPNSTQAWRDFFSASLKYSHVRALQARRVQEESDVNMHDLCTLGHVANKLQEKLNIPQDRFKGIKVKFAGRANPGDDLCVLAWQTNARLITFITTANEEVVHTDGYITLY